MSSPVQLYVYDLSNGLARQLSMQLTGRQIDGIWHTSIVVFGKEILYGQGISIVPPGQSHHGRPLKVVDMGETAIDSETFEEYLQEMREHYTADKYHLLDFNCNSFTNDCVGFLTGGSIPEWIRDLPSDFLSTPFGAALRPTIDNMFRRPAPNGTPTPQTIQPSPQAAAAAAAASPNPDLAATLLQAIASRAQSNMNSPGAGIPNAGPSSGSAPLASTSTLAEPIHICTNASSFNSVLKTHRAVVSFFTSATCGPCRMIEPTFERLAHEKTRAAGVGGGGGIAFVKVDLGVGMSQTVAREYGVRVTPTFIFFLDGKKTHEMKGADKGEFASQVDLLVWDAFPPHPHTQSTLSALDKVSTNPILFTQVPALDTVLSKLISFIDAAGSSIPSATTIKQTLSTEFIPYLKGRFPSANAPKGKAPLASPQQLAKWAEATRSLALTLQPVQLFPVVDIWRLAILENSISNWITSVAGGASDPIQILLVKALETLDAPTSARNYTLTILRLLSNTFANDSLARYLLAPTGKRIPLTSLLVATLLHSDASVRTAAASLAFNISAFVQKGRLEQVRARYGPFATSDADGEWEVELVSAILEAISNEVQNEDIIHRLTASLAFLLRFSPVYDNSHAPLLEVLQAKDTLRGKLVSGGCGEKGVQNKDVRVLVEEVADKLC